MAFDMYADDLHEIIGNGEEFVLEIASQTKEIYPELDRLNSAFWDDPTVDNERAGLIVHELIDLLERHGNSDPNLTRIIGRLLPFFSKVFCRSYVIRCKSD